MMDPTTLSILWERLIYVAEEQAKTLVRVSFTSQSGEMQDIASAVFDSQGNMLAEGITGTIGVITALMRGLKQIVREYPPETLAPGDVLIGNDPWVWSGHTFDLAIVRPVFWSDKLIGFTATITHLTDIGGKGWATSTREIYEEGLRLPIMRLYTRGKLNQDLLHIVKLNVRTPEDVEGDILAQVAATDIGARRLVELVEEYDLKGVDEIGQAICARSEAATKEAIRAVPPGTYRDEIFVGGFEERMRIAAAIRTAGDHLLVDYSGTSPQIPQGINATLNYTLAHTVFNIKRALCPDVPNNEGTYRPITVEAPKGSLLNAMPPAPLVSRHVLAKPIERVLYGALVQALPDRVIADSGGGGSTPSNIKGLDADGKHFMSMMTYSGSMGALSSKDGFGGSSSIAVVPAEILENQVPILVLSRRLVTDSGGPGKYRGGCGIGITMRLEGRLPAEIGFSHTRDKFQPRGRLGGQSGKLPEGSINNLPLPSDKVTLELKPGDIVMGESGGGGGFYPPEEREPEKVLRDVTEGWVSLEKAAEVYKVVIDGETMEIDWQKTRSLRNA